MGKEKKEEVYVHGGDRGWTTIKYSGIFDFNELMNSINSYLGDRNYIPVQKEHSEKITPAGREVVIDIEPFRDVTEYVRFNIRVSVLVFRMVDVMVEEEGRKVKKQKGDLEFMIKANIKKNWKKTFSKTSSGEFFRQTYEKYFTKKMLSDYEDKLEAEANELIKRVKEVLHSFKG